MRRAPDITALRLVTALLSATFLLLFGATMPSRGDDACDQACLQARMAQAFSGDPAAMAHHAEAMTAYLKQVHGGALVTGEAPAVGTSASQLPQAEGDLSRAIRDYLKAPVAAQPAALPSFQRVAQAAVQPVDDGRSYVGEKLCTACHKQEATNWAHTIHAKVFDLNPQNALQGRGCEACHGPGSAHVKNPSDLSTIISFSSKSQTPVPQQNSQCLACHSGGPRIFWHASIHESNNLACSDCHNPMANFSSHGLTARQSVNETCFACHKEQRAQFTRRSHMPLLEGKLSCVDCHNPHGSATAPLLKADSVNEVCYSCHADKRGPFIFEHAPVRESCLNCHTPHGSNYEALLTTLRARFCASNAMPRPAIPAELMTTGNLIGGAIARSRV